MANIKEQLKQKAFKGQILENEALAIGQQADELLQEAVRILNEVRPNFGLFVGGSIDTLVAKINKRKPPVIVDREPNGQ